MDVEFQLPIGYVDASGGVHRRGTLRPATVGDEIAALAEPRVQDNEAYLPVAVLARVVTRLGDLDDVTPSVLEGLYVRDFAFLEALYLQLNGISGDDSPLSLSCPGCGSPLVGGEPGGGSRAGGR